MRDQDEGPGGWRVGACVAVLSGQSDGAGHVASTERGCALRKVVNMGQALRARALEWSPWTSESQRSMAVVTLVRVTVSQESGNDLEVRE